MIVPLHQIRSLKRILSEELDRIILVICPNTHHLHKPANSVFVRQVYWGFGYWEDEPSYERVCELREAQAVDTEHIEIIMSPCLQCLNYAEALGKLLLS